VDQLDHVETHRDVGPPLLAGVFFPALLPIQQGAPLGCGLHDALLLLPVHSFGGSAVELIRPGLDFHEDQFRRAADPADQIHLTSVERAEVSAEDFVSGLAQEFCRPLFAFPAKAGRRVGGPLAQAGATVEEYRKRRPKAGAPAG
jgi:hypothetical protein